MKILSPEKIAQILKDCDTSMIPSRHLVEEPDEHTAIAQAQLEDCERQAAGEIEKAKHEESERIMSLLDEMSDCGQLILPIGQIRQVLQSQAEGGNQNPNYVKPKIVCLCGSTRFVDTFNEWRKRLTLDGKIVLSIEIVTTQKVKDDPQHNNYEVKIMLDELHLRKIDLADEVVILNVGGYIGESTRNELGYAIEQGKTIIYLEPV